MKNYLHGCTHATHADVHFRMNKREKKTTIFRLNKTGVSGGSGFVSLRYNYIIILRFWKKVRGNKNRIIINKSDDYYRNDDRVNNEKWL